MIVAVSGSLSAKSLNTALLRACQKLAPDMQIEILDIGTLPLFNQDLEGDFPAAATALKAKIQAAEGVIIATPEFNRTPPGPLKNFLDWTSRPDGEPLVWANKPVAIFGSSSGARGASFAQYDIRRIMSYFNARTMQQPELYIGNNAEKFDTNLELTDAKTIESLKKFLAAFSTHIKS